MRVASNQFHAAMGNALQTANAELARLWQQMSSGERLSLPSDDPITSVRLLRLAREEAALTQYRDNIGALKGRLAQNEGLLSGMVKDSIAAQDLLLWALDGSNTAQDLRDMAAPLQSLRDSLFYTANSRDQEGRYLFAGTASQAPALHYDATQAVGARYSFAGNSEPQLVVVGPGVNQAANVTLENLPAQLNRLDAAIAALQQPGLTLPDAALAASLRDALQAVDDGQRSLSGKIATQGGAQNTLALLADNHGNVSLANQQNMQQLGRLDYAQAFIEMNSYMLSLQASQKAYGRVSTLSLFEVL